MAKFTYFKVKGKLTDSIFNEMLEFFQNVFPTAKGYKLPPSYYAIKKTFKTIGLGYESIHACVNDCFLFRGDANKDVHFCPVCNTSRWKDSNTPGKKVPKKVLRYFPIIPRLQRLYKSSHTAKEMTWHATGKCTEPGKMQHPVDGRAWKDFDTKYLDFAAEPRNVRLGLAADGFNPFGNLSQSYSMWPVILTTYNLPPWLCMKESSFMLTLLIPGPKSPGKDIDVYLRPLIDDLKVLWAKPGVETIDVATGLKFNMRAMVLWTINDFPARSSLSGWSGQGYKACPTCNEDTPSVRVLGKTAYVGHRRFLKKPHKWRRSLEFNGETENGDPPREFSRDAIMTQLARLPTRVKGKHPRFGGVKIKRNVLVELNWTKRSIFYELEYWSFHTLKHNLDVMHIEKNVLESILNTLLMNDKSKDTAKARQDLKSLGIRSGLWLGQNKNGKCSKPQAAYSFTPADRKKFCQFIKGVKLPDGFGSNFKHKVTDNDTNITGLKSHDCHIMMQRLLPYGLQQYLPPDVAKPLIELCLFFKQICSQTLMVDDMLKAQSKVIDILCNLELIYPPAFFDIMIHLVIHLPLEAIFGGPIRPRWMYPFERYMKKLKNYVRNKAKPEGSIAEGYVAEEALTFSSHYFRDVTTKFNRPDRNVDCPPPTCQFQVFKSLCKSIGLRSVIRIDHQELKKVIWYVLHNSPEIDTYRAKFKIEFPNKDMKEEFPGWFGKQIRQRHVDNDPGVNESSELFALACGPSQTPISVNSCVVNGVRFVVHSRDERRTTQNSGICSPGPDGEMYYGQLEQILEFSYLSFKTVLFRVKWFDTSNKGRIQNFVIRNNITQIKANGEAFKNDQYILATQVKQCFYLEDMARRPLGWKVVEHVSHKKFLNGGVIVVEDDPDVIHVDNSSDLALSTSLNDLEIAALHIDGQSIDVDAPPDIIDVVDEDDDIIDEEDPIPHDLADSDDEDLVNLDIDDGVNVMSADVARGHGGDGGGDDRPPPYQVPTGCGGCLGNRGKGTRKPNLGGRRAGRLHTRQETRNLGLKAITDKSCPVPIWFEVNDRETLMPLGDHAAHWANYLGELVRELPLHYPSWRQMSPERKAGVLAKIGTQHLQKIYNGKKAALKERYWVPEEDGTYDLERLRRGRPSYISEVNWDAQLAFWNDPKNLARAAQINKNRKEQGRMRRIPSIAALRDMHAGGTFSGVGRVYARTGPLHWSDDKFSHMFNQLESQPEYGQWQREAFYSGGVSGMMSRRCEEAARMSVYNIQTHQSTDPDIYRIPTKLPHFVPMVAMVQGVWLLIPAALIALVVPSMRICRSWTGSCGIVQVWTVPKRTQRLVQGFLGANGARFNAEFGRAMVRLGNVEVKTGTQGEIRRVYTATN
ncbi:zinc finger, PHD-type containing protein [Tanacetum coccineum]